MGGNGRTTTRFSDLIEANVLQISDGYRAKNSELGGHGALFLRAGHVSDTAIDFNGVERFHEHLDNKVSSKLSRPGDVIVTTKRNSTGRVAFVTNGLPQFVYLPHLSYWRSTDHEQLWPGYLRYWSRGLEFRRQLDSLKTSTDMAPYLSLIDQKRLTITLPPLPEQCAIARILGTLDDKIELNRRMNETLEEMARAIFKSWFVDIDPVRAKANGQQPAGMDAQTAALFPDSFVDSPLGKIPKGWEVKTLPELIEVNPTRSLRKEADAPYLDMKNMPTRGHVAGDWIRRPFGSGTKFINGDTLLARITPCLENGKTAFVDFLSNAEVDCGSTEYIILRPKPPMPVEFAYFLARSDELRSFAIQNMTGTSGRQRVPPTCFDQFFLVAPPSGIAERFGRFASGAMVKIMENSRQSTTLATLRDLLLPKLLSGEIPVKEAEKFLEAAT